MKKLFDTHPPCWLAALLLAAGRATEVAANPAGLNVVSGSASLQTSGQQLNVQVSPLAVLNWQSFNIAAGEKTTFVQPSQNSVVVNLIGSASASQIYGSLTANGTVILANANGFYFGPNSFVSVGGSFIATTAPAPQDLGAGGGWRFTGMPPLASIVNYGQISVGTGRSLYLIAEDIANQGDLSAPGGSIDLAAGQQVLVSETPDGRSLSATVTLPAGSVDNFGRVTADGGSIAVQAQVVNQNGILQADSVQNQNGVIELVASDAMNLGANSLLSAQGDSSAGGSPGGTVTIRSGNTFSDASGSQIVTAGGVNGGNGGDVEVSAPYVLSLNSTINAGAQNGATGGAFILDPENITLGTTGSTSGGTTGTINGSSGSSTLAVNVNTAFKNITSGAILLEASGNITLATPWNLSTSTGKTTGQLTLEAGQNIIFNSGESITDANGWGITLEAGYSFTSHSITSGAGNIYLNGGSGSDASGSIATGTGAINLLAGDAIQLGGGSVKSSGGNVTWQAGGDITIEQNAAVIASGEGSVTLEAGYNFSSVSPGVTSGTGNIYLNNITTGTSDSVIETSAGSLSLIAGNSVLAGMGSAFTTGGGNVFAEAEAGTINTGLWPGGPSATTYNSDYIFNYAGTAPNSVLGGFSTANGGDVSLVAGASVVSTPKPVTGKWPGAAGAYGAGDVTVVAGGQITGNYVETEGTGTLLAGAPVTPVIQSGLFASLGTSLGGQLGGLVSTTESTPNASGNIGQSSAPVLLSLVSGTWNVVAANNIFLNEVNNPNGTYNTSQSPRYDFNYAANAAANLWADNGITLVGSSLPRTSGNNSMPPVYAPDLSLNAGAGGITVDNSLILYPSAEGSLAITTRAGGSLTGLNGAGIIMSGSSSANWVNFGAGGSTVPLHLNDPNDLVQVNLTGNLENIGLSVPEAAQINVLGDIYNISFNGENLHSADVTGINVGAAAEASWSAPLVSYAGLPVGGDLSYPAYTPGATFGGQGIQVSGPGKFAINAGSIDLGFSAGISVQESPAIATSVTLANPLSALAFSSDLSGDPALAAKLQYNAATGQLTVAGLLSAADQAYLLANLGTPAAAAIEQLYAENQLDVRGASLAVTTSGNLAMTSTEIANYGVLGSVSLSIGRNTQGTLDVGDEASVTGDQTIPKGIFTASGGDVSVVAGGTINVNGSRIAAYDGGNITVESLNGDINAGTGGSGYVAMTALELDPVTGAVDSIAAGIPGSGILATTLLGGNAKLGNILVEAPNGSVLASAGGIVALHFNDLATSQAADAVMDVLAGYELDDLNGQPTTAAELSDADTFSKISLTLPPADPYAYANLLDSSGQTIGHLVRASENRNIDASGSGIIGENINAYATGEIKGVFVGLGRNPTVIDSPVVGQTTFYGSHPPDLPADFSGPPPVIISPTKDTAATAPAAPSQTVAPAADSASTVTTKAQLQTDGLDSLDDGKSKKGKGIALAQKVSRVTVLLPGKK